MPLLTPKPLLDPPAKVVVPLQCSECFSRVKVNNVGYSYELLHVFNSISKSMLYNKYDTYGIFHTNLSPKKGKKDFP